MVFIARFLGAAAVISLAAASPMPVADSAIGEEVAVSAPNGTPISDTAGLAQETAASQTQSIYASQVTAPPSNDNSTSSSSSYGSGSSDYGSGSSDYGSGSSSYGSGSSSYGSGSSSYGSGSSNWGGSGYSSCVQQCVASYGAAPYAYTPTGTSNSTSDSTSNSTSSGSGATHTVIVAPTQGILRYVPFALNASVGDTVKFVWGANNHTVTKSSELTPCNKTSDTPFASGTQNQSFEFTQVVNSTDTTFYYCGTPTHCQKGMFGIINPPSASGAPTSVDMMASSMAANNSDMAALCSSTEDATKGNSQAASWGGNIDSKGMPSWSNQYLVENTMYVRSFLAANPGVLKDDGSIDLSNAANTPLMFPQDLSAALSNGSPSAAPSSATPPKTASVSPSPTASAGAANALANSGSSNSSPRILVGLMVVFATLFAL